MLYLAGEKERELVRLCKEHNVGFICMKGLAGGLIANSKAAMAFMTQYENALPIWGIQKESELDEWLSFMEETPVFSERWRDEMKKIEGCLHCNRCVTRCPYELNTPELLKRNLEDYQNVLAGRVRV